jgi:hypothetical protein
MRSLLTTCLAFLCCYSLPASAEGLTASHAADGELISKKDAGLEGEKSEDVELAPSKDYQESILSNPYADSYARMNTINNSNNNSPKANLVDISTEIDGITVDENSLLTSTAGTQGNTSPQQQSLKNISIDGTQTSSPEDELMK